MNITKTKLGLLLFGIFLLGMFMGVNSVPKNPEPKDDVVIVQKNENDWHTLKVTDDRSFIVAGETIQLCSEGMSAVVKNDAVRLNSINTKIGSKSGELNFLLEQRKSALKKLGY